MSHSVMSFKHRARVRSVSAAGLLAILVTCLMLSASHLPAEVKGPQPGDKMVTKSVTYLLRQQHLSRHQVDKEMSHRWLTTYLKTIDPGKMYFVQADIDDFNQYRDSLGDLAVKEGDISFAYTAFNRFLERVHERVKLVDELLKEKPDFTVDEEMITDPDKLTYAKSDAEMRDNWRRRVKYDLLVLKAEKALAESRAAEPNAHPKAKDPADNQTPEEKISRRYHGFEKRMRQTDSDELLEMYLTALTTSYDPHSTYMSPSSQENFEINMRLKLEGIGAALQLTPEGFTIVSKIIPGGAADKEGHLKKDDKVIGVGQGEDGEIVDVQDMKLNDVVKLIRGPEGTTVRLQAIPAGTVERKVYNITRAEIELTDQEARSEIILDGNKPNGQPYKIGVIDLPSFYMDMSGARAGAADFKSTTRDVAKLLKDFNEKHVDAVILDLRLNGGGSLTESINLTGLFIDTGPVVQVRDFDNHVQKYDDPERGMAWTGPLVVLTSRFSASASEIFAGAIQDYKRGIIVGDYTTHGKGTVQSLLDLGHQIFHIPNAPKLGALKITMQQFYRPNGDSTQNRGVLADVALPSLRSQWEGIGESSLDYAMKFDRVAPASYQTVGMVEDRVVKQLNADSKARRDTSKDFDKVLKNIQHYNDQKSKKRVTLNEKKFLEEKADLNAEKDEEAEFEEMNDPNRPVVKRDFYFNEALAITEDYTRLLRTPDAVHIGQNKRPVAPAARIGQDGLGR